MTAPEKQMIRAAVEAFEAWQKGLTQPLMQRLIEKMEELRKASGEEGCITKTNR